MLHKKIFSSILRKILTWYDIIHTTKKSGIKGKQKVKKLVLKKSSNSNGIAGITQVLQWNASIKSQFRFFLAYLGIRKQLRSPGLEVQIRKRRKTHWREIYLFSCFFPSELFATLCHFIVWGSEFKQEVSAQNVCQTWDEKVKV